MNIYTLDIPRLFQKTTHIIYHTILNLKIYQNLIVQEYQ